MPVHNRLPCPECHYLITVDSPFCCYCGRINDLKRGSFVKSWNWFKDTVGWLKPHKGNLKNLAIEVDEKIASSGRSLNEIKNQLTAVTAAVGLNDLLKNLRSGFLKSGGGSINELLKSFSSKDRTGFDVFNQMTDPEFFFRKSCLSDQLEEMKLFLQTIGKSLSEYQDFRAFQPRDQLEALLDKSIKAIVSLLKDEAKIDYYDQVFSTSFQAMKVLNNKLKEYSLLKSAISIEFWKAEGVMVSWDAMTGNVDSQGFDKKIDGLKSDGNRRIEMLKDLHCEPAATEGLIDRINAQLKALEEARLTFATSRAMGVAEGVRALDKGYPEAQRMLEKFYAREQKVEMNFSLQIMESFEKAKEEEIRLMAEKRIGDGTTNAVRSDSPYARR